MNFDVYSFLEKDFLNWCGENFLQVEEVKDSLFQCGDKKFLLLEEKNGNIFDANFHFILNAWEKSIIKEVDSVVYKWGTRFYYTDVSVMEQPDNDNIKEFKYIGTTTLHTPSLPFLGVRGQYEILNGSRNYTDWVSKAQFLDISVLGICEKNTLAGTMAFQQSCQKKDIKSILGETITINNGKDLFFEGKVFALNHKGWQNILQINAEINVINPSQFVSEERLLGLSEGVAFVFDPLTCPYDILTIKKYQKAFDLCYFKLDSVQYENEKTDQTLLESTQQYLNNSIGLKPILLCDAYYLDKDDFEIKKNLNLIAGVKSAISHNQYFKSDDENLVLFSELFKEQNFGTVLLEASESLLELSEKSDWIIPTGKFNLPEYKMNPDEVELYDNRDDLFDALVFAGWEKYRLSEKSNVDVYLDRLQEEVEVLRAGGFIDYFLILHDILKWCEGNDILVGVGRGSAAGSLVSYLLDITKVDPIKYGLLFERFLNKGRLGLVTKALINETIEVNSNLTVHAKRDGKKIQVEAEQLKAGDEALDLINEPVIVETVRTYTRKTKGTVPDIDTDFESARRDEVKQYMENKYGADRVCSIGSYTSLQMRAVFRDFCKLRNVPLTTVNFLSKIMFETRDNKNARASKAPWEYIFKLASRSQTLYDFVQDNADMIEETRLCHAAPRAASVHPCATLILPEGESIYTSVPIRKTELNNSELIVTEWEGPYVEAAGYLKEDILGIIQLDKFRMIINLVKEHYGEEVDIYSIPLDEPGVFDMISKGLTSDVFQLGSKGLTAYCMQVKPTSVEELCAMVALFRPGPMENNFHLEYVAVKNGKRELTYMPGLEDITKETYGLLAYQEQIMLITTHLADFTMQEADNIRKGMGKVDKKFFAEQGQKFIDGAVRNGYDREYIEDLWESMCSFGGYAYNKCLSGNTKLLRYTNNKSGRGAYHPTIAEMYKIRESYSYAKEHNHLSLRDKYRGEGFGTCWSLNEQNRLAKNKIVDIYYQGMRDVYKLTTESGKTIICTDNHKFPTVNGKRELKNLVVGKDQIFVSSGYKQEDTTYRFNEEGNNFPVKGQQGFQTRNTGFTQFDKYRNEVALQKEHCDCCGAVLDGRREVHHKDFNHGNNDWDNLETLCVSCHKKKHFSNPDRTKPGEKGLYTHLETIISIEYAGKEEVYDVEMADPYHTLTIDNGIVTSNSHALSYAQTAYISQYLKFKYPLPYWITAFEFASDDNLPRFISEMNKIGDIVVAPPDINKSELVFHADFSTKKIIWSISKVKQCGPVATAHIFEERDKNGPFFDLKDLIFRVDKSKVNKSVVENLILAGAFDEICDIKMPSQRKRLLHEYRDLAGTKVDKNKDFLSLAIEEGKINFEWWWLLQQKRISGLAIFDYYSILRDNRYDESKYLSLEEFGYEDMQGGGTRLVTTAGIVNEIEYKSSKKGDFCRIRLEQNYAFVYLTLWNEEYQKWAEELQNCEGKILCIKARAYFDTFRQENSLQSDNNFEMTLLF